MQEYKEILGEWCYGRTNKIHLDRNYYRDCNWNDDALSVDGVQNYSTFWFQRICTK